MADGWHTEYSNTGPGVTGTTKNGNITSADQAFQNAQEVATEYYEKQIENEAVNRSWTSRENELNREFQREMSNTAHQREVQDLIAAGLNPVLSAKYGGASTPSGSSATVPSTSAGSSAGNIFGQVFSSAMGLVTTILNNEQKERESIRNSNTSIYTNAVTNTTNKEIGEAKNITDIDINDAKLMSAEEIAKLDRESKEKLATQQIQADAEIAKNDVDIRRYVADKNYNANIYNTDQQKLMQDSEHQFKSWLEYNYPDSMWKTIAVMQKDTQHIFDAIAKRFAEGIYSETTVKSEVEAFTEFKHDIRGYMNEIIDDLKHGRVPAILTGIVAAGNAIAIP